GGRGDQREACASARGGRRRPGAGGARRRAVTPWPGLGRLGSAADPRHAWKARPWISERPSHTASSAAYGDKNVPVRPRATSTISTDAVRFTARKISTIPTDSSILPTAAPRLALGSPSARAPT